MAGNPRQILRSDPLWHRDGRKRTYLREAHLSNLSRRTPRKRGEVDPHLAIARAKIEDAETFEEAAEFLDPREKFAVLNSRIVLGELLALPPSQRERNPESNRSTGPT
jgi:hypothetical protein